MSQAHIIVNLDRREFIDPSVFENSYQLCSMTSNSFGSTAALALLLSNGNGDGGGDIMRSLSWTEGMEQPANWKPDETIERIYSWHDRDANNVVTHYRVYVPLCGGRWEGNRIVVAGEYNSGAKHMQPIDIVTALYDMLKSWVGDENYHRQTHAQRLARALRDSRKTPLEQERAAREIEVLKRLPGYFDEFANLTVNSRELSGLNLRCQLYNFAWKYFDNITPAVFKQVDFYMRGSHEKQLGVQVERIFGWRAVQQSSLQEQRKKGTRYKSPVFRYNLQWMTLHEWDSLIRDCRNNDLLKQTKAWLRKQKITEWQRILLSHYKFAGGAVMGPKSAITQQVLAAAGVPYDCDAADFLFLPVIPRDPFLSAALALQARVDKLPVPPDIESSTEHALSRVTNVPIPKTRIITLCDTKKPT